MKKFLITLCLTLVLSFGIVGCSFSQHNGTTQAVTYHKLTYSTSCMAVVLDGEYTGEPGNYVVSSDTEITAIPYGDVEIYTDENVKNKLNSNTFTISKDTALYGKEIHRLQGYTKEYNWTDFTYRNERYIAFNGQWRRSNIKELKLSFNDLYHLPDYKSYNIEYEYDVEWKNYWALADKTQDNACINRLSTVSLCSEKSKVGLSQAYVGRNIFDFPDCGVTSVGTPLDAKLEIRAIAGRTDMNEITGYFWPSSIRIYNVKAYKVICLDV